MGEAWLELVTKVLPILTFVLGLIGSWLTDSLRDNRGYRIARKRDSVEFQIENYLALQEALQDLGVAAGKVLQHEKSLVQDDYPKNIGAREELRAAVARVVVLEQRSERQEVRCLLKKARSQVASFGAPSGYTRQTEVDFGKVTEKITDAQYRVGEALRKLLKG